MSIFFFSDGTFYLWTVITFLVFLSENGNKTVNRIWEVSIHKFCDNKKEIQGNYLKLHTFFLVSFFFKHRSTFYCHNKHKRMSLHKMFSSYCVCVKWAAATWSSFMFQVRLLADNLTFLCVSLFICSQCSEMF